MVKRKCMAHSPLHGIGDPHATAADGHRNLVLTMAMDLSAKRGVPLALPLGPEKFYR
jgi:myo-inositol 2-dehydrogenase / D-chiro-inositol 1-dehydrogenase